MREWFFSHSSFLPQQKDSPLWYTLFRSSFTLILEFNHSTTSWSWDSLLSHLQEPIMYPMRMGISQVIWRIPSSSVTTPILAILILLEDDVPYLDVGSSTIVNRIPYRSYSSNMSNTISFYVLKFELHSRFFFSQTKIDFMVLELCSSP